MWSRGRHCLRFEESSRWEQVMFWRFKTPALILLSLHRKNYKAVTRSGTFLHPPPPPSLKTMRTSLWTLEVQTPWPQIAADTVAVRQSAAKALTTAVTAGRVSRQCSSPQVPCVLTHGLSLALRVTVACGAASMEAHQTSTHTPTTNHTLTVSLSGGTTRSGFCDVSKWSSKKVSPLLR